MLAYTIILIVAQHLVSADQEQQRTTFIVGQILKDIDCQLTNTTCGKNMIFVPYLFDTTKNSSSYWNCIQRCSCTTDSYEEIDGQCIEQKNDATAKNITSSTYDCSLEGLPCGTNMIFNPVHEINFQNTSQCITQCVCDINYYEENDQCIKKNDILSAYMDNPCNLEPCKVDEIIHDAGCRLTGHKCGINMIFKLISQGITYPSISRYCTQRCVCESEEFVAKTFHCEKTKIHLNDSIESSEFLQYCPRLRYNMDEEITDLGCRLTGFKCGKNMVFVPVEEFFVSENLDPIIGCIQRCKCKEAFIYSKKDGECKKKWYCDGGYCSLGKQVFDYGCMLTGLPCGTNMIFDTMNNNSTEFCIQVCKCAANDYTEINGRCHKKGNIADKYFVEKISRKSFMVGQIFDDFGCFSTHVKCGKNMAFSPIVQFHNISGLIWHEKCLQRCSCRNDKYIEHNKECIERTLDSENPVEKSTPTTHQPCFINANCEHGDSIVDRGCKLSGRKCGTNMEFRSFFLNSSMNVCVQHCLCNNESFVSNRKSCTNRNFILVNNFKNRHEELKKKKEEEILLNCLYGNCSLSQEIIDYGCKLEGYSCGSNMAFRIVDKKKLGDTGITKCTMICECANEFYEKEGECIPKGHQSIFHRYSNPCVIRPCVVGEIFFDGGCRLSGHECGRNMIFVPFTHGMMLDSQYCYQRCSCKNEEFIEKFFQCEKIDEIFQENTIYSINSYKYCPQDHHIYGEEIFDEDCHLTGQRCGPNMIFSNVQNLTIACKQRCICEEEYNYDEQYEECVRKWYCEGGYCKFGMAIYDYGCALTDYKCGINMKFITVIENDVGNCIQLCSCIDEHIEMDGKCLKLA